MCLYFKIYQIIKGFLLYIIQMWQNSDRILDNIYNKKSDFVLVLMIDGRLTSLEANEKYIVYISWKVKYRLIPWCRSVRFNQKSVIQIWLLYLINLLWKWAGIDSYIYIKQMLVNNLQIPPIYLIIRQDRHECGNKLRLEI